MKKFITKAVLRVMILAALLPSPAMASDYVLGERGYWWKAGQAYTRTLVSSGYYHCGYWYPAQYNYAAVEVLNVEDEDFWTKALKYDAKAAETQARKSYLEARYGRSSQSAYGTLSQLDYYGPTVFGQAAYKFADHPNPDLAIQGLQFAQQDASRYLEKSVDALERQAVRAFENSEQQAKIAAILAIASLDRKTATLRTQSVGSAPAPEVMPRVQGGPKTHPLLVIESCIVCHAGAKAAGGIDMTDWSRVDDKVKATSFLKIRAGEMPPPKDVKAGKVKPVDKSRAHEVTE